MKRRHSHFVSRRPRRGVLLLVVLSLLTLFLLLGTTFLVTGNQYRTATKVIDQANRTTFQPADLLERALMQLVRDTNNANSVIRYHSLLRDQYGVDGFVARARFDSSFSSLLGPGGIAAPHFAGVTTNTATDAPRGPTDGQVVEFYVVDDESAAALDPNDRNTVGLDYDENGLPLPHELPVTDDYYNGCLLTFLEGPCRGDSVRVLDYAYVGRVNGQSRVARLRVMAPRRADGARLEVVNGVIADLVDGDITLDNGIGADDRGFRFMINGRPFNGMGVGFNPLALSSSDPRTPLPRLSALELFSDNLNSPTIISGLERALIPNPVNYVETANVFLDPRFGGGVQLSLDPWMRPGGGTYARDAFRPLTRGFVASGDAGYDPATSPLYKTFAGPGDTDESYDAPDYQNMALASQALEPRFRARVVDADGNALDPDLYYANNNSDPPAYLDLEGVTIPSFHRPALANFWLHRLMRSEWLTGAFPTSVARLRAILEPYSVLNINDPSERNLAAQIAAIKRKYILRPLRDDHPDFDGSNPLSHYGSGELREALTSGQGLVANRPNNNLEVTFPHWESAGPWDVDNDGDGVPDSVWVDIGLPVQQTEDGRWYKPLVAMLVEDLDGRLNLNAHGSREELVDADLDASALVGTANFNRNLAQDFSPNAITPLRSSNQLPEGAGWGPPETSLRPILSPNLPIAAAQNASAGFLGNANYDDYGRLLSGRPDPDAIGVVVDRALDVSVPFGRYGAQAGSVIGGNNVLRSPGKTARFELRLGGVLPLTRDDRTAVDFRGDPFSDNATARGDYATPPDFYARYSSAIAATGGVVHESVATWGLDSSGSAFVNRAIQNTPNDSPYELNLSPEARRSDPASLLAVETRQLRTPLLDDAPFAAAELERILRAYDADADKLPNRLWDIVNAFDGDKLAAEALIEQEIAAGAGPAVGSPGPANSLQQVAASTQAAINRRVVTTDSWDLPTPNENWADRLILGADGLPGVPWTDRSTNEANPNVFPDGVQTPGTDLGDDDGDGFFDEGDEALAFFDPNNNAAGGVYDQLFANGCDDYVVVMREDPPSSGRLIDYMRYRITLDLLRRQVVDFETIRGTRDIVDRHVQEILYGANNRPTNAVRARTTATDNRDVNMTGRRPLFSFGGLLAPEVLAGRRMDLNRPFGDGRDNEGSVGQGVVDEVEEAGEPFIDSDNNGIYNDNEPFLDMDNNGEYTPPGDFVWFDGNRNGEVETGQRPDTPDERRAFLHTGGADANGRGAFVDRNNNGVFDPSNDALVNDDGRLARQLFARHLYCLMMALVDENYVAPYDPDDPQVRHYLDPLSGQFAQVVGVTAESSVAFRLAAELYGGDHTQPRGGAEEIRRLNAINEGRRIAMRKLTARRIAQWCVNVVDFRDPDAIQTPFEYDENPWDGWNVVDYNGGNVRPIDGDLTTDENFLQFRDVGTINNGISAPIPAAVGMNPNAVRLIDRTRGVVWGAERPELLITEGMAWHDRRLEDLDSEGVWSEGDPGAPGGGDGGGVGANDDDLDQLRKPKGHAYLEMINPWTDGVDRPAELYSFVDRTGAFSRSSGVRLDRLSDVAATPGRELETRSPVWRIVCVEEHPLVRNSSVKTRDGVGTTPIQVMAGDDPPIQTLNDGKYPLQRQGNADSFWELGQGPWLYPLPSTESDYSIPYNTEPGNLTLPQLLRSDQEYWRDKRIDALAAFATNANQLTGAVSDADNVAIPLGVLERPPTPSDPSFPGFNRFLQPGQAVSTLMRRIPISSRVHGYPDPNVNEGGVGKERIETASGTESVDKRLIDRALVSKPSCYIERAFYMAAPLTANQQVRNDNSAVVANLLRPGFRIPVLSYDLPLADAPSGLRTENPDVGVLRDTSAGTLRVFASKFAAAVDRFDLDFDNDRRDILPLAPIMPGRRAVVGTVGDVYFDSVDSPIQEPRDFFGGDAEGLADRYVTAISRQPKPLQQDGTVLTGEPRDMLPLRRIEMQPSPDPNKHQVAIRMNGRFDSDSVVRGGQSYNITVGEAYSIDGAGNAGTAAPALAAIQPVVAVPIDAFSISEPLDEYLVRQIELQPDSLSRIAQPSILPERSSDYSEEYYSNTQLDPFFFDEPFDLLPELIENQTTPNYRTMHLERLANPLMPWNPPPVPVTGPGQDLNNDGLVDNRHNPNLPVNVYLPVDAHSLDLTAFNSFTGADRASQVGPPSENAGPQAMEEFVHVPDATSAPFGPESRHRRERHLPGSASAGGATEDLLADRLPPGMRQNNSSQAIETALGFLSGERTTMVGPFAALWPLEPARLLWRQRTPSTTSAWTHAEATNGNRVGPNDKTALNAGIPPWLSYEQSAFQWNGVNITYQELNFDFPLEATLGFANRMFGEFHVGSVLQWFTQPGVLASENINVDGLPSPGQAPNLVERPKINDAYRPFGHPEANNDNALAANGYPAAVAGAETDADARQSRLTDNVTTPQFHWPNRPFASAGELLQVPTWNGTRNLTYYSVFDWLYTTKPNFRHRTQVNPYDGESSILHDGLDYDPALGERNAFNFDGNYANDSVADRDLRPEAESTNEIRFRETCGHFGHLPNFFQTARSPARVTPYRRPQLEDNAEEVDEEVADQPFDSYIVPFGAAHYYRLLDYVAVPSRFTATTTTLRGDTFTARAHNAPVHPDVVPPRILTPDAVMPDDPRIDLLAPFDSVDRYREPGRMNVNTMVGRGDPNEPRDRWSESYDGLMRRNQDGNWVDDSVNPSSGHDFYGEAGGGFDRLLKIGHLGPAWRDVALSRRGYVDPTFDPTQANAVMDYSPRRMHPDFPTLFANPFRAPSEGANVPLASMVQTGVDATMLRSHPMSPGADGAWGVRGEDDRSVNKTESTTNDTLADRDGLRDDAGEAGVLLSSRDSVSYGTLDVSGAKQQPIERLAADVVLSRFDPTTGRRGALQDSLLEDSYRVNANGANPRNLGPSANAPNVEISKRATPVPLFSGATIEPSLDTERNSTFRYGPIQKMASQATTRSGVYAVWITVGFFEVRPAQEDARIWPRYMSDTNNDGIGDQFLSGPLQSLFYRVYHEGWTLGQELDLDTGQNRRSRGFYIVDRTLPVAFRPGEDANVSEAILLRRRIE